LGNYIRRTFVLFRKEKEMPKVSQEHLEARRQQIVEAAYRCFGRRGFHTTTMRDVCREAEMSAGAVYNYFSSKEELVEAVASSGRENTRAFIESVERPPEARMALAAIVQKLLSMLDEPAAVESSRFDVRLWGEAVHTPKLCDLWQRGCADAGGPFAEIVRQGQARGEVDADLDPDAVGRVLVALLLGLQVQKAIDPGIAVSDYGEIVEGFLTGTFGLGKPPRKRKKKRAS
jgi:AcrR family transcriptional regulator